MLPVTYSVRETQLFSYTVASGDMRAIDVNQRTVYLRGDAAGLPVMRGEVPGCSADCHANLSQVLLEYALSCQGCQDQAQAGELVACTMDRLGRLLAARLYQDAPAAVADERVARALRFVVASLDVPFVLERTPRSLRFELARCPLHTMAAQTGLSRGLSTARCGLVALCASMLQALAPDWTLTQPVRTDDGPIIEIVAARAANEAPTHAR